MKQRSVKTRAREGRALAWTLWTLVVFSAGYTLALRGPTPNEVLERFGVHVRFNSRDGEQGQSQLPSQHEPEGVVGSDGRLAQSVSDSHQLLVRVGEYVGAIRTRMDELSNNRRENSISRNILRSRGEGVEQLDAEDARFAERLADLQGALDEALLLERRLQDVVDVESGLAVAHTDERGTLTEAEGLLARMRLLGVDPTR